MKIYLIGMPGSGKSTLGESLADSWEMPYIDLDKEIENKSGKRISEIFKQEGEPVFRQTEASLLREISASSQSFIMSTGGGAPCHHQNLEFMNNSGLTLYLKVSITELEKRLEDEKASRPLLAESKSLRKKIKQLVAERGKCYDGATYVIESDGITLLDIESVISKS